MSFFRRKPDKKHPDDHCKLVRVGRDEYKYYEGDRALVLQVDMLIGNPNRQVYSSTIERWLAPHEGEAIDSTRRREIAERIGVLLEEDGHTVEIQ